MDPPTGRSCFHPMGQDFHWRAPPYEPDEPDDPDWNNYHEGRHAARRWPPKYMSSGWRCQLRPRASVWDAEYFDFLGDCRPPPAFVEEKWSEQEVFRQLVILIETSWSLIGKSDPDAGYFKVVPQKAPLEERWNTLLNLDEALRQLMRDWWVVPSSHEGYQAILSRYPPLDMTKRWMDVYHTALHRFKALRWDIDNEMEEKTETITRNKIVERSPRSLLDLPQELLGMVISFCEPFVWDETRFNDPRTKFGVPHWNGTDSIRALRLTCKTLSWLASLYLVPEVRVALTSDSLARLEQISQHPFISRGVRSIRLDLSHMLIQCASLPTVYVESVANQMMGFHNRELCPEFACQLEEYKLSENVKSTAEAWREACGRVQRRIQKKHRYSGGEWFEEKEEVWKMLREEIPLDSRRNKTESDCCRKWELGFDPKIIAESHVDALRRGYELHQQRFQDHLATRRRFCDEVSQAMSRMPQATRLEITDGMCGDPKGKDRHWVVPVPEDWDVSPFLHWSGPTTFIRRPDGPGWEAVAKIREQSIEKANKARWQWDQSLGPRLEFWDATEQLDTLMGILFHLPGALESQSVQLTRLEIKTSLLPTDSTRADETGTLDHWEVTMVEKAVNLFKNLQYLEFTFRNRWQRDELPQQGRWDLIEPLKAVLSQAVSSPELRFLKISMPAFKANFDQEVQNPTESDPEWWKPDLHWLKYALFESQDGGLRWKELQHLELEETILDEFDLQRLLTSSPKLAFLSLNGMRLIEGTWYQVLEDLREWRQSQLQANIDPETLGESDALCFVAVKTAASESIGQGSTPLGRNLSTVAVEED